MPPRRSCFRYHPPSPSRFPWFQCHHGVPASGMPDEASPSGVGFNATTAFLLPVRGRRPGPLGAPVCFNATTAFLLQSTLARSFLAHLGFQCHHGVPASSICSSPTGSGIWFQCHHGVPASRPAAPEGPGLLVSFNATTAFLLPRPGAPGGPPRPRFNATTAFLLHGHI